MRRVKKLPVNKVDFKCFFQQIIWEGNDSHIFFKKQLPSEKLIKMSETGTSLFFAEFVDEFYNTKSERGVIAIVFFHRNAEKGPTPNPLQQAI